MAFDGIVVANLAYELKEKLINGRISKIAQPETDELLLTVKSASGQYRLLISADASLPPRYLTDTKSVQEYNPMLLFRCFILLIPTSQVL